MTHTIHVQRTAVVTGAARGIGAAVARRLAGDGLAVGVIDLDEADCADTVEAITSVGGAALAVAADVADEAAVTAAVTRIAAAFGPPTVLVNNAGIGPRADLVDMTTQQWDTVLGINLSGPFFAARAVCPHMVTAGWGRIVKEFQRRAEQSIPVGRVGLPDDIAHTASFLVSPGAGCVSGQVIYVAGGPVD
ncbi:SDR family NAD(P)-dependent oxidoreductase [Streptomyces lavendulocolor]